MNGIVAKRKKLIGLRCGKLDRVYALPDDVLAALMSETHCAYTGVEMNHDKGSMDQLTIERVDCSKGYVPGNVLAITKRANSIRSNKNPDNLRKEAKDILKDNANRKKTIEFNREAVKKMQAKIERQLVAIEQATANMEKEEQRREYLLTLAHGMEAAIKSNLAEKYLDIPWYKRWFKWVKRKIRSFRLPFTTPNDTMGSCGDVVLK